MDPLITNGVDPALLRIVDKRGHERDGNAPRKRAPVPPPAAEDVQAEAEPDEQSQDQDESTQHKFDDLA